MTRVPGKEWRVMEIVWRACNENNGALANKGRSLSYGYCLSDAGCMSKTKK
ncbi:hypothetical protein Y017_06935 [Alcanivorax sp. 97CO-5]|nr:hypothetical protein Y017_06935 [Alcanivorax sp. 97CO-5]